MFYIFNKEICICKYLNIIYISNVIFIMEKKVFATGQVCNIY